ncbi:MAG TPA: gephyrin-like molybdotransferase Glp [Terriglobales bacterium]
MPASSQPDVHGTVLSFQDARRLVQAHANALRGLANPSLQKLALLDALGRTLAAELLADRDLPPFPRATRDGYAVRSADLAQARTRLKIVGQIKAGGPPPAGFTCLRPGEAVEIMTGAPVPEGADAVVMVEHTESRAAGEVIVHRKLSLGENIVRQGSEAREGQLLAPVGTRLDYPHIALAASVGAVMVEVFARPRVAILTTGDEVVPITVIPGENQIRNSNRHSLAAQVMLAGGEPVCLPIAPDEPHRLRELIVEGLGCDLLLISGGVSMGKYDFIEQVLAELSAEFFFTGCRIQPGKPVVFGRMRRPEGPVAAAPRYFFGLPGNPVSTMVTFELFVKEFIFALSHTDSGPVRFAQAKLKKGFPTKGGLTRFLPGVLAGDDREQQVELLPWQGSGDIVTLARANCYVVVHPERERYKTGERITVLLR